MTALDLPNPADRPSARQLEHAGQLRLPIYPFVPGATLPTRLRS